MMRFRDFGMFLAAMALVVALSGPREAVGAQGPLVLTTLGPVHALTTALAENTSIRVKCLLPPRTRPGAHARMLKKRMAELSGLFREARAVVGLRSIWPADPLYPLVRRENIEVVEIDAARPVDPALEGVAIWSATPGPPLVWHSSANASRMADLIASDLRRLSPIDAAAVSANLSAIKHRLFAIQAGAEIRLAGVDCLDVVALTDDFRALTNALGIHVAESLIDDGLPWTQNRLDALSAALGPDRAGVVLARWRPSDQVMAVVHKAGARLAVLEGCSGPAGSKAMESEDFFDLLKGNVRILVEALEMQN